MSCSKVGFDSGSMSRSLVRLGSSFCKLVSCDAFSDHFNNLTLAFIMNCAHEMHFRVLALRNVDSDQQHSSWQTCHATPQCQLLRFRVAKRQQDEDKWSFQPSQSVSLAPQAGIVKPYFSLTSSSSGICTRQACTNYHQDSLVAETVHFSRCSTLPSMLQINMQFHNLVVRFSNCFLFAHQNKPIFLANKAEVRTNCDH